MLPLKDQIKEIIRHPKFKIFSSIVLLILPLAVINLTLRAIDTSRKVKSLASDSSEYELLVVGGGEGGVAAAIEAARAGISVALLEETDWLGGMMTAAGVTSMDGNDNWKETGIYKEFLERVRNEYKSINKEMGKTCYWSKTSSCFEPHVGRKVIDQMINEVKSQGKKLDVYYQTYPVSVILSNGQASGLTPTPFSCPNYWTNCKPQVNGCPSGTYYEPSGQCGSGYQCCLPVTPTPSKVVSEEVKINEIMTQNGKVFRPKMVIDATEYGDVLALSGADYRAGNTTNLSLNPAACVQDITYTAVVKKYPQGVPAELNLTNVVLPSSLQAKYNAYKTEFTKIVTKTGSNDYTKRPVNWVTHNAYRGMPDSSPNAGNYTVENPELITKTGINWANDYPYKVGDLSRGEPRRKANCEAKLKTILFIYYVQKELGEPLWSVANDEGYDTNYNINSNSCVEIPSTIPQLKAIEKYLPQIPYIRESRRVIGDYTTTGKDIKRVTNPPGVGYLNAEKFFEDSVALGTYPVDLHNCSADSELEGYLGETNADKPGDPYPFAAGPFQIPYTSIYSKKIANLLTAGKTISVTRLANGASRNQPISMLTGQAAGTAAVFAVTRNIAPAKIPVKDIQHALLDKNVILAAISDILPANPLFKPVQLVRLNSILYGHGDLTFSPDDNVERRQMAIAITNMLDLPKNSPANPTFVDVPVNDPYYSFIEALYASGITSGCSTNPLKFCPDGTVTKAQLMTFFMKVWNKVDPGKVVIAPDTPTFTDMPKSHWAYSHVESMVKYAGLENVAATLEPLTFNPSQVVTRGYLLPWIVRILNL